jgi:hypothetical protein
MNRRIGHFRQREIRVTVYTRFPPLKAMSC